MGPSDSDVSRLLAGEPPVDDPGLSEVAGFLTELRHSYPPASVAGVREAHLAAVVQHAQRQAGFAPPRRHRVARRRAAIVSIAALSVFSAGVGVAAAMGADPLALLPGLRVGPPETPRSATPVPAPSEPVPVPSSIPPSRTQAGQPATPGADSTKPPHGQSGKGPKKDDVKSNNGKSDQAKAEHKPTAMPTQAKNDKADPPANRRPGEKSTPPANRGKAAR